VSFRVDEAIAEDAVRLVLTMKDGSQIAESVEHATGSPQNPLSDERLTQKFMTLASQTLGEKDAGALLDRLWHLDEAGSIAGLLP
jgi:2-methylcitrate dehydratase PrpD